MNQDNQPVTTKILKEVLKEVIDKQDKKWEARFKIQDERFKAQDERFDKHDRKFEKLEKLIKRQKEEFIIEMKVLDESNRARIELLAENLLDVREKITILTEMVEKNTEDIEVIKLNIELIRKDLKTKVEREEFSALEKRVFALEQKERRRVNC